MLFTKSFIKRRGARWRAQWLSVAKACLLGILCLLAFTWILQLYLNVDRRQQDEGPDRIPLSEAERPLPNYKGQLDDAIQTLERSHTLPIGARGGRWIPRNIFQTYRTTKLSAVFVKYQSSWARLNPGWTLKLYNDSEAAEFVRTEWPEYWGTYRILPHPVMRADMFRYLIVLRYGGVYTDLDTECMVPLDTYVRATDRMIVSEERNFDTLQDFQESAYVRQHQILQWTFIAAPHHPMLYSLVNHIVHKTRRLFYVNSSTGLVRRPPPPRGPRQLFEDPKALMDHTGPGIFTDETFACLEEHGEDFVTVLPEEGFGIRPWAKEHAHFRPSVVHHFHGSWKAKSTVSLLKEQLNEAYVYSKHAIGEKHTKLMASMFSQRPANLTMLSGQLIE